MWQTCSSTIPDAPGVRPVSGHEGACQQRRDRLVEQKVVLKERQREQRSVALSQQVAPSAHSRQLAAAAPSPSCLPDCSTGPTGLPSGRPEQSQPPAPPRGAQPWNRPEEGSAHGCCVRSGPETTGHSCHQRRRWLSGNEGAELK